MGNNFTYNQTYYSFNTVQTIRVTNGTKNTLAITKDNTTESYSATLTKTALSGANNTFKLVFLSSTFSN